MKPPHEKLSLIFDALKMLNLRVSALCDLSCLSCCGMGLENGDCSLHRGLGPCCRDKGEGESAANVSGVSNLCRALVVTIIPEREGSL